MSALFWWSAEIGSMGCGLHLAAEVVNRHLDGDHRLPSTSAYRLDMSVMKPILTLSQRAQTAM